MMPHRAIMWLARLFRLAGAHWTLWAREIFRLCWCLTVALMLLLGPEIMRDRLMVIALASVLMGLHRPLPRGES
jgi:hypothetical protein